MTIPSVSILCTTYNHAHYIEKTIKSFLKQKTNFEFEILIHDDASTDETLLILKKYKKLFPEKIHLICEKTNQFSNLPQGGYFQGLLESLAKGKYIALCEGDDYWIDETKLQAQYDYLENNPDCVCCGHASWIVDSDDINKKLGSLDCGLEERDLDTKDVLEGKIIQTASLFYRRGLGIQYAKSWSLPSVIGDLPWLIYLTEHGRVHYDPRHASAYRTNVEGSYSSETDDGVLYKRNVELLRLCDALDVSTRRQYHESFQKKKQEYSYRAGLYGGLPFFSTDYGREMKKSISCIMWLKILARRILVRLRKITH